MAEDGWYGVMIYIDGRVMILGVIEDEDSNHDKIVYPQCEIAISRAFSSSISIATSVPNITV